MSKALGVILFSGILVACSKGGQLTLESNARIVKTKGSPFITINQGGKALVVEQGQTPSTGVHGWVAIQTISSSPVSDGSGNTAILR